MNLASNLYIRPSRLQSQVKSLILQQPYATQLGPITTVPQIISVYLSSYDIDMLTFVVQVSFSGSLYGILVTNYSQVAVPTAQQVYLGLDSTNLQPAAQSTLNPCQPGSNVFAFNSLQPLEWYNFCVVIGNLDPNPTLNTTVVCLLNQTQYPPSHITLRIKWAGRLIAVVCVLSFAILWSSWEYKLIRNSTDEAL